MPAKKHPSSRSVAFTILAVIAVISIGAYSLGVMNMKKAEPEQDVAATEVSQENTSQETSETPDSAPASTAGVLAAQPNDIIIGKAEAPVTITEYFSLSCTHCADFHANELSKLQASHLDTGKAKLVIRHFPLNAPALKAAQLVNCVPVEDRRQFVKVLLEMQKQWAFTESYLASLKQIAAVGGVSGETFDTCMADKAAEQALIKQTENAGTVFKVDATPTFFVNGEKFPGAFFG